MFCLVVALAWDHPLAESQGTDEATLKAVFLERFTRFVQWPSDSSTHPDTSRPFVICVLDDHAFAGKVRATYRSARISGRRVVVLESSADSLPSCQVLFIGKAADGSLERILQTSGRRQVLTIGDSPGFGRRGVCINFFLNERDQVRFEVNRDALSSARLKMSHLLLNVARVVSTEGEVAR